MTAVDLIVFDESDGSDRLSIPGAKKFSNLRRFADWISSLAVERRSCIAIAVTRTTKFDDTAQVIFDATHSLLSSDSIWLLIVESFSRDSCRTFVLRGRSQSVSHSSYVGAFDCNGRLVTGGSLALFDRRRCITTLEPSSCFLTGCLKYLAARTISEMQGASPYSPECCIYEFFARDDCLEILSSQLIVPPQPTTKGSGCAYLTSGKMSDCDSGVDSERVQLSATYLFNSMAGRLGAVEVSSTAKWFRTVSALSHWRSAFCKEDSVLTLRPHARPVLSPISGVLDARESATSFSSQPMSIELVSSLLCAAVGGRDSVPFRDGELPRRNYPTAGSLASVGLLMLPQRVDGIAPTLQFFDPTTCTLSPVNIDITSADVANTSAYESKIAGCALLFFLVVDLSVLGVKYGERAARLGLIEVGHLAQNLLCVATGLGLASCPIAGFDDLTVSSKLHLDAPFLFLPYLVLCGHEHHTQ